MTGFDLHLCDYLKSEEEYINISFGVHPVKCYVLFQPAYALIGSLNGIHVFGESHGVTLCTTRTQNANLVWKTYHDR